MINLRKSLALFLSVIMIFSSLSVFGFAADEIYYTVETYLMDTAGNYSELSTAEKIVYAESNESVEIIPDEIEGFTFDSENSEISFTVQPDNSSVAKIYYSRNKYTATYIYEDLLGAQTEESLVYYGAEIPSFEANPSGVPVLQGYNFIMWSLEKDSQVAVPSVMPANDINMYPIYELKEYTYTFDAGENGSFSDGSRYLTETYFYGDVASYPDETPTMTHFEFVDWDYSLPSSVTKNMTFTALYNEISYAAIFMDGEDEISYLDGYYYGDIIEEIDIPEGYEAWTLSDGTYVSFPYTVSGNEVFYAAKAPSYYTARFYLDIEDTEAYEEFSVLQGEEIDFPADPEKEGYTFIGWNSDITIMPDEDIDFIAEWKVNEYTVTFDTDGGEAIEPLVIAFGEAINPPANISKDGYVFLGWDGIPDDGLMPASDIILTAKWEKSVSEDYLEFRTELYTFDENSNEWVIADKLERGEKVKARVFIETGFAVGDGQMLCFYNDDVFSMDSATGKNLVVNTSVTSSAAINKAKGTFATPSKTSSILTDLVDFGYISQDFLDKHSPVTFTFNFSSYKCHSISADEWFAEFDLTVKDDAVGIGDFFIVPETIVNSEDGYYAYITLTKGEEGSNSLSAESMLSWNASTSVNSNPVSTRYGRIILDANGGTFASTGSNVLSVDYSVGETVSITEYPDMTGYNFVDWDKELPVIMTDEIFEAKAIWSPCSDTYYKILVNYYDFTDGEGILTEKSYDFYGTTDNKIEIVNTVPSSPEENTEYILISDLIPDYNVIDSDAENEFSGLVSADGSTVLEINFVPVTHIVIFDANGGEFSDGDTIKYIEVTHGSLAIENVPYAEISREGYNFIGWIGLTDESTRINYDQTFTASWDSNIYYKLTVDALDGILEDGSSKTESYHKAGTTVRISEPVCDGYIFNGWYDENGNEYKSYFTMPENDITLTASWTEIPVETTTQATTVATTVSTTAEQTTIVTTTTTSSEQTTNEITEATTTEPVTVPTTTESVTKPSTTQPVTETSTTEPTTEPVTVPTTTEPVTEASTTQPVTEPSTTEPTTTEPAVTQPTTVTTTKPVVTEPTTVPTTVHQHTPKTVVINATCEETGEKYQVCNECGVKIGNSTVIPALGHSAGEWQTVKEATYESQGLKVKKCTRNGCGKILEQVAIPVLEAEKVELSIRKPSITTISYGDSIYLHAETELPAGAKVVWSANNSNFTYSVSSDGLTCLITPSSKGETEFTAKVVDSKGNVISEICTQKMTSNAGFFQKIIAFFKRLFGLTKVYPESIVFIYDK